MSQQFKKITVTITVLSILLLASCSQPTLEPTPTTNLETTLEMALEQTIAAQPTNTLTPTETITPNSTETLTPTVTFTPEPTKTRTSRPSFTPTQSKTPDPSRYYSPDGYVSFVPHRGIENVAVDGENIILLGPNIGGYDIRLGYSQRESIHPLAFYSALAQGSLNRAYGNITTMSEEFMETNEGKTFFRWEIVQLLEGDTYHITYYFFESGSWKLTMIYSRLLDYGREFDSIMDEVVKTVEYDR